MADVTMDLSELDKMRDNIKKLEKTVKEKEAQIIKLECESKTLVIKKTLAAELNGEDYYPLVKDYIVKKVIPIYPNSPKRL